MKRIGTPQSIQQGFLLIEAMVALMVVSLGALALISFNATLLRDSGTSKIRTEALQIAQNRIDQLRHTLVVGGCNPNTPPAIDTSSVDGVNASYVVDGATTVNNSTSGPWVAINVCVAWDGSTDACGAASDKRIVLNSRLNCSGVGTSGDISGTGTPGTSGLAGFLKTPTGRAVVGGQDTTGTTVGSPDKFGNKIVETNQGDRVLVSANGKAQLSIKKLACEDDAPPFSTMTGRIYVEADNKNNPLVSGSDLFALSSDASYCQTDTASDFLNQYVTANGVKYYYVDYLCYVGAEWWGNIGVVRTDQAATSHRVCSGNTLSTAISGSIYSKDEKLGSTRGYRGYREVGSNSGVFETVGIGETDSLYTNSKGEQCVNNNRYLYVNRAQYLKKHHFVVTSINGQATDASCGTALGNLVNVINAGGDANTVDPNPPTGSEVTVTANRNPGKFYCLTDMSSGTDCGNSTVTPPPARSTRISGTIKLISGAKVSAIEAPGATCTATDLSAQNNYYCDVNWEGWTGETWTETLTFTSSHVFCSSSLTYTISPSGSEGLATVVLNNTDKSLKFSAVPPAVTSIVANFTVAKTVTDCP